MFCRAEGLISSRTGTVSYALYCSVLGYVDAILDGFNCVGTKTIPDKDTISSHIRTMISTRFLQRSQTAPHRSLKVTDSHISWIRQTLANFYRTSLFCRTQLKLPYQIDSNAALLPHLIHQRFRRRSTHVPNLTEFGSTLERHWRDIWFRWRTVCRT